MRKVTFYKVSLFFFPQIFKMCILLGREPQFWSSWGRLKSSSTTQRAPQSAPDDALQRQGVPWEASKIASSPPRIVKNHPSAPWLPPGLPKASPEAPSGSPKAPQGLSTGPHVSHFCLKWHLGGSKNGLWMTQNLIFVRWSSLFCKI